MLRDDDDGNVGGVGNGRLFLNGLMEMNAEM